MVSNFMWLEYSTNHDGIIDCMPPICNPSPVPAKIGECLQVDYPLRPSGCLRDRRVRWVDVIAGLEIIHQEEAGSREVPDEALNREMATGTNSRGVNAPDDGAEPLTPKWTPKLTPTAFSECNQLSTDARLPSTQFGKAAGHKHLQSEKLSSGREAFVIRWHR